MSVRLTGKQGMAMSHLLGLLGPLSRGEAETDQKQLTQLSRKVEGGGCFLTQTTALIDQLNSLLKIVCYQIQQTQGNRSDFNSLKTTDKQTSTTEPHKQNTPIGMTSVRSGCEGQPHSIKNQQQRQSSKAAKPASKKSQGNQFLQVNNDGSMSSSGKLEMNKLRLFSGSKPGQKVADTPSCQCTPTNASFMDSAAFLSQQRIQERQKEKIYDQLRQKLSAVEHEARLLDGVDSSISPVGHQKHRRDESLSCKSSQCRANCLQNNSFVGGSSIASRSRRHHQTASRLSLAKKGSSHALSQASQTPISVAKYLSPTRSHVSQHVKPLFADREAHHSRKRMGSRPHHAHANNTSNYHNKQSHSKQWQTVSAGSFNKQDRKGPVVDSTFSQQSRHAIEGGFDPKKRSRAGVSSFAGDDDDSDSYDLPASQGTIAIETQQYQASLLQQKANRRMTNTGAGKGRKNTTMSGISMCDAMLGDGEGPSASTSCRNKRSKVFEMQAALSTLQRRSVEFDDDGDDDGLINIITCDQPVALDYREDDDVLVESRPGTSHGKDLMRGLGTSYMHGPFSAKGDGDGDGSILGKIEKSKSTYLQASKLSITQKQRQKKTRQKQQALDRKDESLKPGKKTASVSSARGGPRTLNERPCSNTRSTMLNKLQGSSLDAMSSSAWSCSGTATVENHLGSMLVSQQQLVCKAKSNLQNQHQPTKKRAGSKYAGGADAKKSPSILLKHRPDKKPVSRGAGEDKFHLNRSQSSSTVQLLSKTTYSSRQKKVASKPRSVSRTPETLERQKVASKGGALESKLSPARLQNTSSLVSDPTSGQGKTVGSKKCAAKGRNTLLGSPSRNGLPQTYQTSVLDQKRRVSTKRSGHGQPLPSQFVTLSSALQGVAQPTTVDQAIVSPLFPSNHPGHKGSSKVPPQLRTVAGPTGAQSLSLKNFVENHCGTPNGATRQTSYTAQQAYVQRAALNAASKQAGLNQVGQRRPVGRKTRPKAIACPPDSSLNSTGRVRDYLAGSPPTTHIEVTIEQHHSRVSLIKKSSIEPKPQGSEEDNYYNTGDGHKRSKQLGSGKEGVAQNAQPRRKSNNLQSCQLNKGIRNAAYLAKSKSQTRVNEEAQSTSSQPSKIRQPLSEVDGNSSSRDRGKVERNSSSGGAQISYYSKQQKGQRGAMKTEVTAVDIDGEAHINILDTANNFTASDDCSSSSAARFTQHANFLSYHPQGDNDCSPEPESHLSNNLKTQRLLLTTMMSKPSPLQAVNSAQLKPKEQPTEIEPAQSSQPASSKNSATEVNKFEDLTARNDREYLQQLRPGINTQLSQAHQQLQQQSYSRQLIGEQAYWTLQDVDASDLLGKEAVAIKLDQKNTENESSPKLNFIGADMSDSTPLSGLTSLVGTSAPHFKMVQNNTYYARGGRGESCDALGDLGFLQSPLNSGTGGDKTTNEDPGSSDNRFFTTDVTSAQMQSERLLGDGSSKVSDKQELNGFCGQKKYSVQTTAMVVPQSSMNNGELVSSKNSASSKPQSHRRKRSARAESRKFRKNLQQKKEQTTQPPIVTLDLASSGKKQKDSAGAPAISVAKVDASELSAIDLDLNKATEGEKFIGSFQGRGGKASCQKNESAARSDRRNSAHQAWQASTEEACQGGMMIGQQKSMIIEQAAESSAAPIFGLAAEAGCNVLDEAHFLESQSYVFAPLLGSPTEVADPTNEVALEDNDYLLQVQQVGDPPLSDDEFARDPDAGVFGDFDAILERRDLEMTKSPALMSPQPLSSANPALSVDAPIKDQAQWCESNLYKTLDQEALPLRKQASTDKKQHHKTVGEADNHELARATKTASKAEKYATTAGGSIPPGGRLTTLTQKKLSRNSACLSPTNMFALIRSRDGQRTSIANRMANATQKPRIRNSSNHLNTAKQLQQSQAKQRDSTHTGMRLSCKGKTSNRKTEGLTVKQMSGLERMKKSMSQLNNHRGSTSQTQVPITVRNNANNTVISGANLQAKLFRVGSPCTPRKADLLDTSHRTAQVIGNKTSTHHKQLLRKQKSTERGSCSVNGRPRGQSVTAAGGACIGDTTSCGARSQKSGGNLSVHQPQMYVLRSTKKLTQFKEFAITPSVKENGGTAAIYSTTPSVFISPQKLKKLEKRHGVDLLGKGNVADGGDPVEEARDFLVPLREETDQNNESEDDDMCLARSSSLLKKVMSPTGTVGEQSSARATIAPSEKDQTLLKDNDAMDAYMKGLCQKYF